MLFKLIVSDLSFAFIVHCALCILGFEKLGCLMVYTCSHAYIYGSLMVYTCIDVSGGYWPVMSWQAMRRVEFPEESHEA